MAIEFRHYDSLGQVPMNRSAWDSLVNRHADGNVFVGYDWTHCWWRQFGGDHRLFFVTAEESGAVRGFIPLMIDRSGTLRFIADLSADYLAPVMPADETAMLAGGWYYAADACKQWRVMHLRNMPHRAAEISRGAIAAQGLLPWNNYSVDAPTLDLTRPGYGRELLQKYSLRRKENALARHGKLRYVVCQSAADAAPLWQAFAQQHRKRATETGRVSAFDDERYLPFLQALFEADVEGRKVHFSAVLLDDRPVAIHYGFVSQGRLLWYKPSFDTTLAKLSPGVVLIRRLVSYALDNGLRELDFTIGEEAFKSRFSNDRRRVDTYRVHRTRTAYALDTGYWRLRRTIKGVLDRVRRVMQ